MLGSTSEVEEWVREGLIRPHPCDACGHPHRYLTLGEVGPPTPLLHTPLRGSFVQTLIDGRGPAAGPGDGVTFRELLEAVRAVAGGEPAWWFYVTDPDNILSVLEWVRACDWDQPHGSEHLLGEFERNPAAEGGVSRLCLAGASRAWLLAVEYHRATLLAITLYAPAAVGEAVARRLPPGDAAAPGPAGDGGTGSP